MENVVIVSCVRTAVGSFHGSLAEILAVDLGATVIREAIKRSGIHTDLVEKVIMGHVLQAGLGQNTTRQALLKAGLQDSTVGWTLNHLCGSGLTSITVAAQMIQTGDTNIVVAGGMENMSQAPFILKKARKGYKMGNDTLVDAMIHDGLWCNLYDMHMGITAENIADRYKISREEQDMFAFESQKKAQEAINAGKFKEEIVPVSIPRRKGEPVVFSEDEYPKMNTTPEQLAKLKPAFKDNGTVTAGNASGINDGAAACVLMSENRAKELGIKPLARIRASACAGVDPRFMGLGPIPATQKALQRANLTVDDLDLIEANEAFASQAIAVCKELKFPMAKVNVNGGAIALGHPIGASGTKILATLLNELKRTGKSIGLATLCIGGGQGVTLVVENLQ